MVPRCRSPWLFGPEPEGPRPSSQGGAARIHQIEAGLALDVAVIQGMQSRQHEDHKHRKAEHGYLVPQEVVDDVGILKRANGLGLQLQR